MFKNYVVKIIKIINFIIITFLSSTAFANSENGIWVGVFDINGHGKYDFTGLIDNNNATAFTEKAKVIYNGNIKFKDNTFEWNLLMYLKDGNNFGTAKITGKIIQSDIMSGKWITEPAKDYGNIYLIRANEKIIDTGEIINKQWASYDESKMYFLEINKNIISGKDKNKCNYYGYTRKLNKKIYELNLEIASCGVSDGIYKGMAHIKKENDINTLILNATNKNFSVFIKLQ